MQQEFQDEDATNPSNGFASPFPPTISSAGKPPSNARRTSITTTSPSSSDPAAAFSAHTTGTPPTMNENRNSPGIGNQNRRGRGGKYDNEEEPVHKEMVMRRYEENEEVSLDTLDVIAVRRRVCGDVGSQGQELELARLLRALRKKTLQIHLTTSPQPIRDQLVRLANVVASDSIGREYLLSDDDDERISNTPNANASRGVVAAFVNAMMEEFYQNGDSGYLQNLLGTVQKLSLRRGAQSTMNRLNLIPFLQFDLLASASSLSDYTLEYATALLNNLCLRTIGKRVVRDTDPAGLMRLLVGLFENGSVQVKTYVNGILYNLLTEPSMRDAALSSGVESLIQRYRRPNGSRGGQMDDEEEDDEEGEDAQLGRQLEFVAERLASDDLPDDSDALSEDGEEEDGNEEEDEDDLDFDHDDVEADLPSSDTDDTPDDAINMHRVLRKYAAMSKSNKGIRAGPPAGWSGGMIGGGTSGEFAVTRSQTWVRERSGGRPPLPQQRAGGSGGLKVENIRRSTSSLPDMLMNRPVTPSGLSHSRPGTPSAMRRHGSENSNERGGLRVPGGGLVGGPEFEEESPQGARKSPAPPAASPGGAKAKKPNRLSPSEMTPEEYRDFMTGFKTHREIPRTPPVVPSSRSPLPVTAMSLSAVPEQMAQGRAAALGRKSMSSAADRLLLRAASRISQHNR
ncbi:LisH domain-containing protein armc9 [Quaeritorhiza haematococci]|nr:LisH domain-containing protein armc9 [Quaeritorhiza haematococci]